MIMNYKPFKINFGLLFLIIWILSTLILCWSGCVRTISGHYLRKDVGYSFWAKYAKFKRRDEIGQCPTFQRQLQLLTQIGNMFESSQQLPPHLHFQHYRQTFQKIFRTLLVMLFNSVVNLLEWKKKEKSLVDNTQRKNFSLSFECYVCVLDTIFSSGKKQSCVLIYCAFSYD